VPVTSAAVLCLGSAAGAELDAVAYLATMYFGMRNFGAIFGTISGFLVLNSGLGALVANAIYDGTHSYALLLWWVIPCCVMASVLFATLAPYRGMMGSTRIAAR
jgi:hypothetical protein